MIPLNQEKMQEPPTIEKRVADAVLERESDTLTLDGVIYRIASPTLATLIMTSELIAGLPPMNPEAENPLEEVLKNARHCKLLGKITAVLILGAKRVGENRQVPADRQQGAGFFARLMQKIAPSRRRTVAEVDKLADMILNEVRPSVLQQVLTRRLIDMEIGDFFGLTTSLTAANLLLKPTREVDGATASGG